MLTFCETAEGVSLLRNGEPLFSGLRPFVRGQGGERLWLALRSCCPDSAVFEAEGTACNLTLSQEGACASLRLSVRYAPLREEAAGQNHLDPDEGLGLVVGALPDALRWTANYMYCPFWCRCRTGTGDDMAAIPEQTQALLWQSAAGGYGYALTTCDREFKSHVCGCPEGGVTLLLYSHYPQPCAEADALILGFSDDPYALPSLTAAYGMRRLHKPFPLREGRRYPEVLEYLGWCSWDAFHMDVTQEGLEQKAQEFRDKAIPVRWMLIDDMWADVPHNDLKTMHSRKLRSFEADPVRFPGGLKAAISALKDRYAMRVGIWHPTSGYWNGIDPDGPIAREHRELLTVARNGRLIPDPSFEKSFLFYHAFHRFLRDCGADFVKVDNQSFIAVHYDRLMPIGRAGRQLHEAIEASVGVCFDGAVLNCMGMSSENFWNRPQSAVNRISNDFQPENRRWFIQHILQCSFNALFQGSLYVGDWDMWWSDDAQGVKNAVLRAMSGGPVYVSDRLGHSVPETIWPLVYRDGRIIRLSSPAVPTEGCLLADPEHNGGLFTLYNRIGAGGVLAAFNLDAEERPVSGAVSPGLLHELQDGPYLLFDYFARTAEVLRREESRPLTLRDYDDFRLYLVLPIRQGIAPIGLIGKYMAPATFEILQEGCWLVQEGGTFWFYADRPVETLAVDGIPTPVTPVGAGCHAVTLPDTGRRILVEYRPAV